MEITNQMPSLSKQYRKEIRQRFNWEEILEEAEEARKDKENGYVYLDTAFSLMPSCKDYPPKESYDYEPCPKCHGSKTTKNNNKACNLCGGLGSYDSYRDEQYWLALEHVADSYGLWVAKGEEDHYCVFAGIKIVFLPQIGDPLESVDLI